MSDKLYRKIMDYLERIDNYILNYLLPNVELTGGESQELKNVYKNNLKLRRYFDKVMFNRAHVTNTDILAVLNLLVHMQAVIRTFDDKITNITKPDEMDEETLNLLLNQFGFVRYDLMDLETKRSFLLDLAGFFKMKGTPDTVKKVIEYITLIEVEVFEYWLVRNRNNDELAFIGKPTSNSEYAELIGNIYTQYETLIDGYWMLDKTDIVNKDKNNIQLPSMSPYFSIMLNLDIMKLNQSSIWMGFEMRRLWDLYNSSDENLRNLYYEERRYYIKEFTEPIKVNQFELWLAMNYIKAKKYGFDTLQTYNGQVMSYNPTNPESTSIDFLNQYKDLFEKTLTNKSEADDVETPGQCLDYLANTDAITNYSYLMTKSQKPHGFSLDIKDYGYAFVNPGRCYIFGGIDNSTGDYLDKIYYYNGIEDTYIEVGQLPYKLRYPNVVYVEELDRIYIMFGMKEDGSINRDIIIYDVGNDYIYEVIEDEIPIEQARIRGSIIYMPTAKCIVIGPGYTENGYIDNIFFYGVYTLHVTLTDIPGQGRIDYALSYNGDKVYIIGGFRGSEGLDNAIIYDYSTDSTNTITIPKKIFGGVSYSIFENIDENEFEDTKQKDVLFLGGWTDNGGSNIYRDALENDFNGTKYSDIEMLDNIDKLKTTAQIEYNPTYYVINDEDGVRLFNYNTDNVYEYPLIENYTLIDPYNDMLVMLNQYMFVVLNNRPIITRTNSMNILMRTVEQPNELCIVYECASLVVNNNDTRRSERALVLNDRMLYMEDASLPFIQTAEDNLTILQQVHPDFANHVEYLLNNVSDKEFTIGYYEILFNMDAYFNELGIETSYRSGILQGDETILKAIVEQFKPIHSRFKGMGMSYIIRDNVGDAVTVDEYWDMVLKHYQEEALKLGERNEMTINMYMLDIFSYMNIYTDQNTARTPEDTPIDYKRAFPAYFDGIIIDEDLIIEIHNV